MCQLAHSPSSRPPPWTTSGTDGPRGSTWRRHSAYIEDGAWNDTLRARPDELEARKAVLARQIDETHTPAQPVSLHPNAAELYRTRVADLEVALNAGPIRREAAEALRQLIEAVVLTPDTEEPDGLAIDLQGDLAMILRLAVGRERTPRQGAAGEAVDRRGAPWRTGVLGGQLSGVAGTGNHRQLTPIRVAC